MDFQKKARAVLSLVPFWIKAAQTKTDSTLLCTVDLAFSCPGIATMQVRSELLEFGALLEKAPPKAFLEIGTRNGGTFFVLCRLAAPSATVISLDLPGGRFGGGYTLFQIPVIRHMRKFNQRLHLLRANSHSPETRNRVARALDGKKLDLLFVDGDHTYRGVKQDFEMYSPFVGPGGIVAFHDIVEITMEGIGVKKFWDEIKSQYSYREIIADPQQGWGGIGLLFF